MDAIVTRAQARVGLLGNPSDLYGGRGLGFTVAGLEARVRLDPDGAPPGPARPYDPLVDAGWKVFGDELRRLGREPRGPGAVEVVSNIPLRAGLSGSSAILIAALRAWARAADVRLEPARLARLALRAEVEELGIRAGPLDRLVQAHGGLLEMDFAEPFAPGATRRLDPAWLPPLLLAWDPSPGADSGDVHAPVFARWKEGDETVHRVVADLAALAVVGREALEAGDLAAFRRAVNKNLDLRARLFRLAPRDREAIDLGRRRGAATKFCGSGGSYLVVPEGAERLDRLREAYEDAGFSTLVPSVGDPMPSGGDRMPSGGDRMEDA